MYIVQVEERMSTKRKWVAEWRLRDSENLLRGTNRRSVGRAEDKAASPQQAQLWEGPTCEAEKEWRGERGVVVASAQEVKRRMPEWFQQYKDRIWFICQ
jgi:hypothetical protein